MPNITDVAKLAGVSHQTVSRVLNDADGVRPGTKARVDAAIRELGYRPSAAARALATRKSHTIGLVTTGTTLYGPSSIMLAFNEAARAAGYRVTIASLSTVGREGMISAIDGLLGQDPEALVLIAADFAALEAVSGIDIRVPLITVASTDRLGFHSVAIDQFDGGSQATQHLVDLGHRHVLHISGPAASIDATERLRGWRHTLETAGLAVWAPVEGDWGASSGYHAGRELVASGLLGGDRGASAVFCANDQMSIGLLHALADAGIRVPDEASVIGFDDIPESEHFAPPLTTMRQDFADLGERMLAAVLQEVGGDVSRTSDVGTARLVVRRSTARLANPGSVTEL